MALQQTPHERMDNARAADAAAGQARLEAPTFGDRLHQVTQAYDADIAAKLANLDGTLTPSQFRTLHAVERHQPCSQTALVYVTGIDRSTLADIVHRLCRRQLLQRHRTKKDARAYAVKLTADGAKAVRKARDAVAKAEKVLRPLILSTLQQEPESS